MIANFAASDIRPGSMGRPLPGVEAGLLERGEDGRAEVTDGHVRVIDEPGIEGELALRPGWPSMFRICTKKPATRHASRTAGTSRAISRSGTGTVGSGSGAAPMTSSSRQDT
jgi:acyl-coenzyme A synthetase/AMP-(fatty) acid ligase